MFRPDVPCPSTIILIFKIRPSFLLLLRFYRHLFLVRLYDFSDSHRLSEKYILIFYIYDFDDTMYYIFLGRGERRDESVLLRQMLPLRLRRKSGQAHGLVLVFILLLILAFTLALIPALLDNDFLSCRRSPSRIVPRLLFPQLRLLVGRLLRRQHLLQLLNRRRARLSLTKYRPHLQVVRVETGTQRVDASPEGLPRRAQRSDCTGRPDALGDFGFSWIYGSR